MFLIVTFTEHNHLWGFALFFDLGAENNLPTWFQSSSLLVASALSAAMALAAWRRKDPFAVHWTGLAAILLLLSLDEMASIHERISNTLEAKYHPTGMIHYIWVVPALVLVVLVGIAYARFLRNLPPETRRGFLVSGIVFVAGAAGFESVQGWHASRYFAAEGQTLAYRLREFLIITAEETLEMVGVALFIYFVLRHWESTGVEVTIRPGDESPLG